MESPMREYELRRLDMADMLQAAERFRLAKEAVHYQQARRFYSHVLASTGDLLVKWGRLLQERYGEIAEMPDLSIDAPCPPTAICE